ncbi:hypothetical protein SFR_6037 [Streptomyces sp. FR-008]|nr:hypothetical protein SFR_6037 [Streptomyces sp. FR-008]
MSAAEGWGRAGARGVWRCSRDDIRPLVPVPQNAAGVGDNHAAEPGADAPNSHRGEAFPHRSTNRDTWASRDREENGRPHRFSTASTATRVRKVT